jgi:pyrroloquinoline-quinone synthase
LKLHAQQIAGRLDEATEDARLLQHPFYQAWTEGSLTRDDLRFYSTQYFRQVEAFPGYLRSAASKLKDGGAREIVLDNLSDEIDGDHAGLWLAFANGVGASHAQVQGAPVEPETAECIEAFQSQIDGRSAAFALGMLYGYESQTPAVAETKIAGLRTHYGIDGPAVEYFALHGELDVEHTAELAAAIASVIEDEESLADATEGAKAGAAAIYRLLDGVARVRGIAC